MDIKGSDYSVSNPLYSFPFSRILRLTNPTHGIEKLSALLLFFYCFWKRCNSSKGDERNTRFSIPREFPSYALKVPQSKRHPSRDLFCTPPFSLLFTHRQRWSCRFTFFTRLMLSLSQSRPLDRYLFSPLRFTVDLAERLPLSKTTSCFFCFGWGPAH